MKRIVVFASGNGTTFDYLATHGRDTFNIIGLFCNRRNAGVIEKAHSNGVPVFFVEPGQPWKTKLKELSPDLVVLAGYLMLLEEDVTAAYRVINTHPALLPNFGGRGMYGARVHQAVLAAGETYSGVTVHRVNEVYDQGEILAQAKVVIDRSDTWESLAHKVQEVEKPLLLATINRLLEDA